MIFLLGSCVFTLGSVACGIFPDFEILQIYLIFQGIDTALFSTVFTFETAGKGIIAFFDLDPSIFMQGFQVSVIELVLWIIVRENRFFRQLNRIK